MANRNDAPLDLHKDRLNASALNLKDGHGMISLGISLQHFRTPASGSLLTKNLVQSLPALDSSSFTTSSGGTS